MLMPTSEFMNPIELSIIIPARNEERLIEQTIEHALRACQYFASQPADAAQGDTVKNWELIVVDNASTDRTCDCLQPYQTRGQLQIVPLPTLGAARARNVGRLHSRGRILVFIDADTMIPPESLSQISLHCHERELVAGITSLAQLEGGLRAWAWWSFWNHVRRLPLARAKAMPALMFCTTAAFDTFGPFDEAVAIGEEWPILAGLYQHRCQDVIYDRSIIARSSSRRMNHGKFGYTRTLLKYAWAILAYQGRVHYTDRIR
jgi:glycosyltransferase involved in cell wall biosynthesis